MSNPHPDNPSAGSGLVSTTNNDVTKAPSIKNVVTTGNQQLEQSSIEPQEIASGKEQSQAEQGRIVGEKLIQDRVDGLEGQTSVDPQLESQDEDASLDVLEGVPLLNSDNLAVEAPGSQGGAVLLAVARSDSVSCGAVEEELITEVLSSTHDPDVIRADAATAPARQVPAVVPLLSLRDLNTGNKTTPRGTVIITPRSSRSQGKRSPGPRADHKDAQISRLSAEVDAAAASQ